MNKPQDTLSGQFRGVSGKVLVATPLLEESIFERSVIFICEHDKEGAIGVILNKPTGFVTTQDVFDAFGIKRKFETNKKYIIYTGGPVENDKLFILTASKEQKAVFAKRKHLSLCANAEGFLLDVVRRKNVDSFLICKGFCGWDAGQLEQEVKENSWMVADVDFKTIFAGDPASKWYKFIKELGITDTDRLVSYSGHA